MHMYLFYECGECNDSLRDRSFYLVEADTEKKAYRRLLEHLWFLYRMDDDQGHKWTAREVKEQYSVFLSGNDIKIGDLGYDVNSITTIRY